MAGMILRGDWEMRNMLAGSLGGCRRYSGVVDIELE